MKSNVEIDLVCCWVKLDDAYEALLRKYKGDNMWAPGANKGRFRELGEIKYSIPLALKNLPWIRKVFIVTNGQEIPNEISSLKKVNVVYHNEIFKYKEFLPTFSFFSIVPNLCFIKDLAENFILTTDDVFITRPCEKKEFLGKSGLGIFNHTRKSFDEIGPPSNIWQYNLQSTNNLLTSNYGQYDRKIYPHSPQLFIKSKCLELWSLFNEEIKKTCADKFRNKNNVIFRILYSYYVIYQKWGIHDYKDLIEISCGDVGYFQKNEYMTLALSKIGKGNWEEEMSSFCKSPPPTFLNLNDNIPSRFYEETSEKVKFYLEKIFRS